MLFEKWMAKALGILTALLAVFGFVKLSNKNAADARENKVKLDSAEALINGLERHKEVLNESAKKVNEIDDIDKFASDNGFLRDDGDE